MRTLLHRTGTLALATLLLVAAMALPALAHTTVRVDTPVPGAYAVYTVRVPNESDTASTERIEVQMPEGLDASRYEPEPRWEIAIADGVMTIEGGTIAPGEFKDFRFQAQNPEEPTELRFNAVQTYDDGEVAEWIGDEDTDRPASFVEIVGETADGDDHCGAAAEPSESEAAGGVESAEGDAEPVAVSATTEGGSGGTGLGIAGLVAGLAGLALGGAAFARTRARTA